LFRIIGNFERNRFGSSETGNPDYKKGNNRTKANFINPKRNKVELT
jgi:hypothetical protein